MTSKNDEQELLGRIERLEEKMAEALRTADDLSEVVARQDKAIELLERRVALLIQREAERQAEEGGGGAVFIDKPPHY